MKTSTIFLSVLNVPQSEINNAGRIVVDCGMNKDPMPHTLATRWAKKLYPEATLEVWELHIDLDDVRGVYLEQVWPRKAHAE